MIIDGKKIAAELREKLKKKIVELKSKYNSVPGLTVILVGEDPASKIYVKNKEKFAKEIGINSEVLRYKADMEEKKLLDKIKELNKNDKVSGILVQLPLHVFRLNYFLLFLIINYNLKECMEYYCCTRKINCQHS